MAISFSLDFGNPEQTLAWIDRWVDTMIENETKAATVERLRKIKNEDKKAFLDSTLVMDVTWSRDIGIC